MFGRKDAKKAKPKKLKSYVWRLAIVSGGKTRTIKLFGGISTLDELLVFKLPLKKGDELYVVSIDRRLGYEAFLESSGACYEKNGNIVIGEDGVYDFHFGIKTVGEETIRLAFSDETSDELAAIQKKNYNKKIRHKIVDGLLTFGHNLLLAVLVFIWLIPIFWLILVSFTGGLTGPSLNSFFPKVWSGENYVRLFTDLGPNNQFPRWVLNTLIVSVSSTIVSTLFVVATAFAFSRFRFKARKGLMNLSMIVSLFPGMLTMVVTYYIFQYVFKLDSGHVRLIIAYSAGAGLGYLVSKGFFDTIPMDIDEAAKIDGASTSHVFFRILIPLSKPTIVYTIITSFMAPWVDFVFAKIILGSGATVYDYTVAIGLFNMLQGSNAGDWFGAFTAGAVIISIPLTALFLAVQKYYVGGVTGGAVKG